MFAAVIYRRPSVAPLEDPIVATGQRVQGRPLILRQRERAAAPQPLSGSMAIHADDLIETDDASRVALQSVDGSSVRIDRESRVRFVTPAAIEVLAGAVYVATSAGSQGFAVRTTFGVLRDVGTQFEVRVAATSLRVRVRTGTVEIRHGSDVDTARTGTEAIVASSGTVIRPVMSYGPDWAWTADIAPAFSIEGRSLRTVLEHMTAEAGWTLRYADPGSADSAARVILHGSIDGLTSEDALTVVLATSGLQYRLRDGELLVSRPAAAR